MDVEEVQETWLRRGATGEGQRGVLCERSEFILGAFEDDGMMLAR